MNKCPFCGGTNLLPFGAGKPILKQYQKSSDDHFGKVTSNWAKDYIPQRFLCKDCGYIFEFLSPEKLKEFKDDMKYEI